MLCYISLHSRYLLTDDSVACDVESCQGMDRGLAAGKAAVMPAMVKKIRCGPRVPAGQGIHSWHSNLMIVYLHSQVRQAPDNYFESYICVSVKKWFGSARTTAAVLGMDPLGNSD